MKPLDQKQFRSVMSHYPTGVCAVTGIDEAGAPQALVVGSFTSVSLDPMLVGFFPGRESTSWPKIRAGGRFCINVLSSNQQDLCRSLARSGSSKFAGVDFQKSPLGNPLLEGAAAWIDCALASETEAGDHFAVLGAVVHMHCDPSLSPLVFWRGAYGEILEPAANAVRQG